MSFARKNAVAAGEAESAQRDLMKAIVQDRFGPPETLQLVDTGKPEIGPGDVLLKVHAAAVNPYVWHILRVDPAGGSDLTGQELVNTRSPGGTVVLMPSGPPGIGRPSLTGKCEPCQPISRPGVGR